MALYDANMEACCGCAVCEAVCPVADCITMVNEAEFNDNDSQWEHWTKDKDGYHQWMTDLIQAQKGKRRNEEPWVSQSGHLRSRIGSRSCPDRRR